VHFEQRSKNDCAVAHSAFVFGAFLSIRRQSHHTSSSTNTSNTKSSSSNNNTNNNNQSESELKMRTRRNLILLLAVAAALAARLTNSQAKPTTTTEWPADLDSDTDDDPTIVDVDAQCKVSELFGGPLSRAEARATLARAMQMLDHQPGPSRGQNVDPRAKNLLRFMTGESQIGSTSEESRQVSPVKKRQDYTPDEMHDSHGSRHRASLPTRRKILELVDAGKSDKAIQAKYPWFLTRKHTLLMTLIST
jgi:hypothetical protein